MNPQTRSRIFIPATSPPRFSASSTLKNGVKEG
ncbi:hypothetical protein [Roseiflexus castenholzii]